MGVAAAEPAVAAAAGSLGAPEAPVGATGVHPEGVAPGGAPSLMRKVLGPPAGAEASAVAAAAGVGVPAAAAGGAGVPALPEAGVAVADASGNGNRRSARSRDGRRVGCRDGGRVGRDRRRGRTGPRRG